MGEESDPRGSFSAGRRDLSFPWQRVSVGEEWPLREGGSALGATLQATPCPKKSHGGTGSTLLTPSVLLC